MKAVIVILLAAIASAGLWARPTLPDSSTIRERVSQEWFYAPVGRVIKNNAALYTNNVGERFAVTSEAAGDIVRVSVSPEASLDVEEYSDSGHKTVKTAVYPEDALGAWTIERSRITGDTTRVVWHTACDSEVFLEIKGAERAGDNGEGLAMVTGYCYGVAVGSSPLGLDMTATYTASLEDVKKWVKLPWELLLNVDEEYEDVRQVVGVIRSALPRLRHGDDAMTDDTGDVYVSNGKQRKERPSPGVTYLSAAGFAKWVADGLVEPLAGNVLKREPLLRETVTFKSTGLQGVQTTATQFALDWVRNLAAAVISVRTGRNYSARESGCDVTEIPGVDYIADTGFPVKDLKAALYMCAIREPDTFYLAAASNQGKVKEFRDCNIAVVLPYFIDGHFKCTVFSDCKEIKLEDYCKRGDFVTLCRVRGSKNFFPR